MPIACICGNPNCVIPFGKCHCECGNTVSISPRNYPKLGHKRGMPVPYLVGHANRIKPLREDALPFKVNGVYCRFIRLTQGAIAIVNVEKYDELMRIKWWAQRSGLKKELYAVHKVRLPDGRRATEGMHRFLLGLNLDDPRDGDHENGNTLDYRIENLRAAERIDNARNHVLSRKNTSGFCGVYDMGTGYYVASIRVNRKLIHLGHCSTKKAAHSLRLEAEKKYFGEFRRGVA